MVRVQQNMLPPLSPALSRKEFHNMKKTFQEPEMTVVTFCIEDVINTSVVDPYGLEKTELPVV